MAQSIDILQIVLIGVGGTVILDLWVSLLNMLGISTLPMALIGRWVGHLFHGRVAHAAIRQAFPIPGELQLGWLVHYSVGIVFAAVLVGMTGAEWVAAPTLPPALIVGIASVTMPLMIMQPAMGAGFASSKTAAPLRNVLRSVCNHTVLGLGFYATAVIVSVLYV